MTQPSSPKGRKVLVTGAGGFIGSHLAAEQREHGHHVVALDLHLDRVAHLAEPGRFDPIEGDVADPAIQRRALEGVDTVFHLAAAHLSVGTGDAEYRRINVEGVDSLVRCSREAGIRRFVHCSSVGVYGRIDNPPADETTACRPEITYERTKLEGESVVLRAVEQQGFPAVVIRPVWVYGPGCPRTEKLFRTIGKGRFFIAGRGDALRHCVYIRDMVRAFELAADVDDAVGQVMIVGDAGAVEVRELIAGIAKLTGSRRPPSIPLALLSAAGLAAELVFKPLGKEPPMSRRTLKFFTANTSFDIGRARKVLGYDPRYDLDAGLRETYSVLKRVEPWRVPLPRAAGS